MKSFSLVAVTLAFPLFLTGCNEDEILGEQLMAPVSVEQTLQVAESFNQIVENNPTAAGLETIPVWKTLSYSESLADAYAERIVSLGAPAYEVD